VARHFGREAGSWLVLAVLGVCGGLSTYSSLALELAQSIRSRDPRGLVRGVLGAGLGLVAGLLAAGITVASR